MTKYENSEIKSQVAEFVATVQVINEEFNRTAKKHRSNGDASAFAQAAIARENAIASAGEKFINWATDSGFDPDEIGARMKAAAEVALARVARVGAEVE